MVERFNLILASDGTVIESSPREWRIARRITGEDKELSPGGMIVMSPDVNAMIKDKGLVGWAKRQLSTYWNRWHRTDMVDKELDNEFTKKNINNTGWSVGNLFKGRFFSNGVIYDEKSFAVDIRGVPFDFVKDVARKLGKEFNQESVLVVDHSNGRTFILDSAK